MKPTYLDPANAIVAAVMPVKGPAVDRAEIEARKIVEHVTKTLAAAGNDLLICAPYPSSRLSGHDYQRKLSTYQLFGSLTKWRGVTYSPHEPHFADVSPELVAKFVKNARDDAGFQYDLFVAKLINKIGDVTSATLKGSHVWGYSFLTVVKADATTETWKTQQIVNVSKHGKLFNQWPTRKVKS